MTKRLIILGCFLLVGGCTQLPPINFSVPNVGPSTHKLDAEVKSITVTPGRPDEAKGELPAAVAAIAPLWQTALIEALNRSVIFRDSAPKKVSISVKILQLEVPGAGISFTTKTTARYEIIDRDNGDIISTQDITSEGTTPGDYAFFGAVRARESVNRSVQNNIALFLQSLETVDLSKPMFPAGSKPPPTPPAKKAEPSS